MTIMRLITTRIFWCATIVWAILTLGGCVSEPRGTLETFSVVGVASSQVGGDNIELREIARNDAKEKALGMWYEGRAADGYDSEADNTKRYIARVNKIKDISPRECEKKYAGSYCVKATISIFPEKKASVDLRDPREYGNFDVFISFDEKVNDKSVSVGNWPQILRGNLTKNGVELKNNKSVDAFNINVSRTTRVGLSKSGKLFGAYCDSWFEIVPPQQKDVAGVRSYKQIRGVGFTEHDAIKDCYENSNDELVEGVIRELDILADKWLNKPRTIYVQIEAFDAKSASNIVSSIKNWDIQKELIEYEDDTMRWRMEYAGGYVKIIEKIQKTFDTLRWVGIDSDIISFVDSKKPNNLVKTEISSPLRPPSLPPQSKDVAKLLPTKKASNKQITKQEILAIYPELKSCHLILQDAALYVYQRMNIRITDCYRTEDEQLSLVRQGRSQVKKGKHNVKPSLAVDSVPEEHNEIGWQDWNALLRMNTLYMEWFTSVQKKGCYRGFQLALGLNWKTLNDPYHIYLNECSRG